MQNTVTPPIGPIKLAIEALNHALYYVNNRTQVDIDAHLCAKEITTKIAALRSIKPDCRCCVNFNPFAISGCVFSEKAMCTNFNKFQALSPVNLTKETK
jgi:hypothetical protein